MDKATWQYVRYYADGTVKDAVQVPTAVVGSDKRYVVAHHPDAVDGSRPMLSVSC